MCTRGVARGERIATQCLQAGSAFVHAFVESDPGLPLEGIARSGCGRELSRLEMRAFVNAKSVHVA